MKRFLSRASLWENVLGSLLATGLLAGVLVVANGEIETSSWYFGASVGIAVALTLIALWVAVARRRYVPFVSYMSKEDLSSRIRDAEREIWSFQISGGEFTQSADRQYEKWLRADVSRRLKLLFANPENEGLLRGIVELSGMGARSTDSAALGYLRDTIRTSLDRYALLGERCPDQVDIRIYDASPPCSVHAVDVTETTARASLFVENYLPRTGWADRPCFLLDRSHRLFSLYARQSLAWFEEAQPYTRAAAEPIV